MSFLVVNGYAVPATGVAKEQKYIGQMARAQDGTLLRTRNATKREWKFSTTPLKEITAVALERMIQGDGHVWSFDSDEYSSKGSPVSGTSVFDIEPSTGADGAASYIGEDQPATKFGVGALYPHVGQDNLLGADSRDCENGTSGFSKIELGGSTVTWSSDTDNYWQGSKSIKLVLSNPGGHAGIKTATVDPNTGGSSAGKTYTASAYVKIESGSGAHALTIIIRDNTNTDATSKGFTIPDDASWHRLFVTHTVGVSDCSDMTVEIIEQENTSPTFYVDAFQLEESEWPTAWVDGTRADNQHVVFDPGIITGWSDFTLNCWIYTLNATPSANTRVFDCRDSSGGTSAISIILLSTGELRFFTRGETNGDSLGYATPGLSAWNMITFTIRKNPETGEAEKCIYIDGALTESNSPGLGDLPDFSLMDKIAIGQYSLSDSDHFCGLIDDLAIYPFAAPAEMVSAWYTKANAMGGAPALTLTGDIISEDSLAVEGEVKSSKYNPVTISAVHRSNARRIDFTLMEV